jgi:hypothetical protein
LRNIYTVRALFRLFLEIKRMTSCQTQPVYDVTKCILAVSLFNTCIESAGGTFDSLIRYITSGSQPNTGSSVPFYSDPKVLKILYPCVCGKDALKFMDFLLCYDIKCAKDLNMNFLSGSGLFWSGFCLTET